VTPSTNETSLRCEGCGAAIQGASDVFYTKAGEQVCRPCQEADERRAQQEHKETLRIEMIALASAAAAALITFGLWVLFYKDKTYVYVDRATGATGADASLSIIKLGAVAALVAAMAVGFTVGYVLFRRRAKGSTTRGEAA
jgi:hypothetical protein